MACAEQAEVGLALAPERASGVEASLELDFEFDLAGGQTVLASSRQQAPLKVVRAFALEDGGALVHLHNVSGGVLAGDRLELRARIGAEASAQLTTTGATRLYRAGGHAPDAVQQNHIRVEENALLEYVPDPIIPYAGACFRQQTSIHLAQGAGLFWWEIVAPGREARGELFAYDRMHLGIDIWTPKRLIASERVCLQPQSDELSSLARLGNYRYWASFYVCRVGAYAKSWLVAEQNLREVASRLAGEALWSISSLAAYGLAVRCLAREGRFVIQGLREIWNAAKLHLYGREAIPPRKVN